MRRSLVILCVISFLAGGICGRAFCEEETLEKKLREIERKMITDGNYKEASAKLEIITQTYPNNAGADMDLALAYYGSMDYEKAYEYFKKADELGMTGEEGKMLAYALANIEANKELLKGIEEDKNTMELASDAEKETFKESLALKHFVILREILKGKYFYPALAVPHIAWLKKEAPTSPGLYELSGSVYYSAMHYKEAAKDYKKAIEENPEKIDLYKMLGDVYVALGDFDSARENYDKAVELYKKSGLKDNSPEVTSIKNIEKAFPRRYKDIADLMEAKRYFEAEEICKRRISLNAGDVAAITQLGQVYWDQQKRSAAINMFRKAIKMSPDYPVAHFSLGRAYFFEKKPDKGGAEFDIFEEKMDLLPEKDKDTMDFYAASLQEIASLNMTFADYKEARKKLEKSIELKPDDARAHYNLAVCLYRHFKDRVKAYNELQKVIELEKSGRMVDHAKIFIDYMRRNPDPRIIGDFSFLDED